MIDLSFDPDADAVIFQITGQGDLQEYRDAIAKLLTQPYFHMNLNTIWDLREGVASDRTVEDLRLARFVEQAIRSSAWHQLENSNRRRRRSRIWPCKDVRGVCRRRSVPAWYFQDDGRGVRVDQESS